MCLWLYSKSPLLVILFSSWLKMKYCWLVVKQQSFNYTLRYITNKYNVINIIIIILILTTTPQNDTLHLYIVWKLNSWKSTLKIKQNYNVFIQYSFSNVFQHYNSQTPLSVKTLFSWQFSMALVHKIQILELQISRFA
jgi:hypothetical protein